MEAHLMTLVYAKKNPWTYKAEDHLLQPSVNVILFSR